MRVMCILHIDSFKIIIIISTCLKLISYCMQVLFSLMQFTVQWQKCLSPLVENDNRLVQEGHQTNENGGDPTANECGQALNAKPNDEHCSPIPAVKEPEETIEDIEQQVLCSLNCKLLHPFKHMYIRVPVYTLRWWRCSKRLQGHLGLCYCDDLLPELFQRALLMRMIY